MSLESVREHLKQYHADDRIIVLGQSSATVDEAAEALGVSPARIAKTLSFKTKEGAILIVAAGDTKIDNKKYKAEFGLKAKMLTADEVQAYTGHEVGGVCPFGLAENLPIYLDESMKRFDTLFPACGSRNSAIELSCGEIEAFSGAVRWVDVCQLAAYV